ncbi:IS4 family transposase [Deinococcus aquatilis]|uniref:IS4 family transposase n=1 Tax=Deinococcus aquatilis TaxID=519440 RepID=UPI000375EB6B|nr:IS4 family transposase [Deinococcus aquatilis]
MKATRSRLPEDTLSSYLATVLPIDPRRLAVLAALILAMIEKRTVCLAQLVSCIRLVGTDETIYQRLKRFAQFAWTDQQLLTARLVLSHFRDDAELVLILDRTNWKWGKADVNFLILSVLWKSFSFPLAWQVLPHSGNSTTATRVALLESVLPLMQGKTVALLADREFIGKEWFQTLKRLGIKPTIRLHVTTKADGIEVWAYFKKLHPGELRIWHTPMTVYGVKMRVLACQNLYGQTLYLAYHGYGTQAIRRYAWRWNAENMHQALKGRGFDLEATRLTEGTRVSLLFGVVSLAFMWCCLSGDFVATKSPPRILKHGYPAKSLFRLGLEALQSALSSRPKGNSPSRPSFQQLLATFDL